MKYLTLKLTPEEAMTLYIATTEATAEIDSLGLTSDDKRALLRAVDKLQTARRVAAKRIRENK